MIYIIIGILFYIILNYLYFYFTLNTRKIMVIKKMDYVIRGKHIKYITDSNYIKYYSNFCFWNPLNNIEEMWYNIEEGDLLEIKYYGLNYPSLNINKMLVNIKKINNIN